jgi:SET domain-containing protein 6
LELEDLEEYFIIEQDSGEPDSEGRTTYAAKLREISPELDEQLRAFLKALKKSKSEAFAGKRRREDICNVAITQALTAKLGTYPTSVKEDEALLKNENLSRRHRMAIEVRLGEKRLLQEAIVLMQGNTNEKQETDSKPATKRARVST